MKLITSLILALILITGFAAIVSADPPVGGPPGQDPCGHGNSNKPCREDPQPDHGKDCLKHGNNGGINEDHCTSPTSTFTSTATNTPQTTNTPSSTATSTSTATATETASISSTSTPTSTPGTPTLSTLQIQTTEIIIVPAQPQPAQPVAPAQAPVPVLRETSSSRFTPPTTGSAGLLKNER